MELVLDTSVLIDAERRRLDVRQMLSGLVVFGSDSFAMSAVSLMELAHGVLRARSSTFRRLRERFLDDIRASIPVLAVSDEIAVRAGKLEGSLLQTGLTIGMADAIIAATVLTYGDAVARFNVKHFKMVPELDVVEL